MLPVVFSHSSQPSSSVCVSRAARFPSNDLLPLSHSTSDTDVDSTPPAPTPAPVEEGERGGYSDVVALQGRPIPRSLFFRPEPLLLLVFSGADCCRFSALRSVGGAAPLSLLDVRIRWQSIRSVGLVRVAQSRPAS